MIHAIISCPSTPQKGTRRSLLITDHLHGDVVGHSSADGVGGPDRRVVGTAGVAAGARPGPYPRPSPQSRRAAARDCRCPPVTLRSWTARNCSPECGTTCRACGSCPPARCRSPSHPAWTRSVQPGSTPTGSGPRPPGFTRAIPRRRPSPGAAGPPSPRRSGTAARRADATLDAAGRQDLAWEP